ncbi:hypothetical protein [Lysobacter capsici]|uniref:hypothetical protein n=1 Tax=Lysobacter capsici TaxID=435897 RepID=UPI000AE5DBC0|nr:hypothetical protein [Lysobacter capsici]
MRALLVPLLAAVALSACGGVEYRDTNAAVDARPECASGPTRPGETPPAWCERKTEAKWNSDSKGEKVDFKKDDAPR